jgi:RimK family alpha-L-glutamate ligase
MKILIAGLTKKRQFERLKKEGEKRGHIVDGCFASDLIILASNNSFIPKLKDKDLRSYDLIYLIVGSRLWEWYTASLYLSKNFKTKIVNKKAIDPNYNFYLSPAIDYLRQFENDLPFPKSAVIFSESSVNEIISEFKFPVILKTSQGHRGEGVSKIENIEDLKKKVGELTVHMKSCVIREFIPNEGDIRVFCVGFKTIGAMKRTPKIGEFRSNISQGGSGAVFDLQNNSKIKELAQNSAKVMQTEIAGVDIIIDRNTGKPYVLEVNPGPQLDGLEKYTGVNAGEEIIKYFEEVVGK